MPTDAIAIPNKTPIPSAKQYPKKIGFNPTHAIETEFAAEITVASSKMTDRRTVSLIDNNRFFIVLCHYIASTFGQSVFNR
jgi:hypothetical protein